MTRLLFGTAHLFGLVDASHSEQLLVAAYDAGIRRFDTAPSYGHGQSEARVGAFVATRPEVELVTTKVGIAPPAGPAGARRMAKKMAALLPRGVTDRLRAASHDAAFGNFEPAAVRDSVDRSLQRLGRINRLLLHEVRPGEITDDLLTVIEHYQERGDIGQAGVATQNEVTAACLALAPSLLSVAHIALGPMALDVELPAAVTVVGHGIFGAAAGQLRAMSDALGADAVLRRKWEDATADTEFAGAAGLQDALLVRAANGTADELIVATSRADRISRAVTLTATAVDMPAPVATALSTITASASRRQPA